MEAGQPSRTALRAAHSRARHQGDPRRILTDPLAPRILRLDADDLPPLPEDPTDMFGIRFLAARSRFAEDALAAAVASGTRQLVVLGAGLDTFAYRNPHAGLRVFEVDHPATQAWKRQQLAAAGIGIPPSVTFAPVDFEHDTLAGALAAAGLDRTRPAFFLWLGVTPYLTRDAVLATLRFMAGHHAPVQAVFDYCGEAPPTLSPQLRAVREAAAEMVAELGEPWLTCFAPEDIAGELQAMELGRVEDLTGRELIARYVDEPVPDADAVSARVLHCSGSGAVRRFGDQCGGDAAETGPGVDPGHGVIAW
ncbi:class I SAM-dependent methyltransferase [Streptomyces sp. NPDC001262]|uniref:class I SAM-dependent methyltransferase n=1 Tax=Streptomyces sp. NPDC001262 TaxID=3364552 RepID=UPI0036A8E93F